MPRILSLSLLAFMFFSTTASAQEKIRIGYIGLSLSSMPILAARDLGHFLKMAFRRAAVLTFQLSSDMPSCPTSMGYRSVNAAVSATRRG